MEKKIKWICWNILLLFWKKAVKPSSVHICNFIVHFWKEVVLNRILNVSIIAIAIPIFFESQISDFISDTKRDSVKKVNDLESFELFRKEMIGISISIDVLYELLNSNNEGNKKEINEKIDKKYKDLEKNVDNFYNNFDRNIRIIKKNLKREKIKKRKCGGKEPIFVSESECNFKKIDKFLKEVNKTLNAAYKSYNNNDKSTLKNTLGNNRSSIKKIQTDIISFLDKLNEN